MWVVRGSQRHFESGRHDIFHLTARAHTLPHPREQVLEGPLRMVRRLMDTLIVDDWHDGAVHILDERHVHERLHADFGMAQARHKVDPDAAKRALRALQRFSHEKSERGGGSPSTVGTSPPASPKPLSPQASFRSNASSPKEGDNYTGERKSPLVRLQSTSLFPTEFIEDALNALCAMINDRLPFHKEHGIGGLLCFDPSTMRMTQTLEGPEAAVDQLYAQITDDPRHIACTLLSKEAMDADSEAEFEPCWTLLQTESEVKDNMVAVARQLRDAYRPYEEAHANSVAMKKAAAIIKAVGPLMMTPRGPASRGSPVKPWEGPMILEYG